MCEVMAVNLKGIHYIVDEKGRRKYVVISYKAYLELLEDLSDLAVIAERSHEPRISFDDVLSDLKQDGRLSD